MEKSSQRKGLRGPSPAMVVACIALAVALSGVSYAASQHLMRNSVGTAHLKNGAVSAAKIKANAVNSSKVANNSLTGADINEGTLQGVDAASVGGIDPDDLVVKTANHLDAFVAAGSSWVDADDAGRSAVTATLANSTQVCTLPGASVSGAAAYQDIHLPQGAQITQLVAEYVDDAGTTSGNGAVRLVRQPLFSEQAGSQLELFTATLINTGSGLAAGLPGIGTDSSPAGNNFANAIVDNTQYAYSLEADPGSNTDVAFCNVRVTYEMP